MSAEYPSKTEIERRKAANDFPYSDRAKQDVTGTVVRGPDDSRTVPREAKPTATVVRLAAALGKDPAELAAQIPEDTLRRTRYAMKVQRTEDGKTIYEHDLGIVDGVRSLIRL